jgi:hypothetical protein
MSIPRLSGVGKRKSTTISTIMNTNIQDEKIATGYKTPVIILCIYLTIYPFFLAMINNYSADLESDYIPEVGGP